MISGRKINLLLKAHKKGKLSRFKIENIAISGQNHLHICHLAIRQIIRN